MDFMFLGKKVLFFSLALLTGLFITQAIIEAHSPEPESFDDVVLIENNMETVEDKESVNTLIRSSIQEWVGETEDNMVSINSPIISTVLESRNEKGTPFAYVSANRIFIVDHKGKLLAPADSLGFHDLPIISGDSLKIYSSTFRLAGDGVSDALNLIKNAQKQGTIVYSNLSEINIQPKLGLVVYSNISKGLPLIVGSGSIEKKIRNLRTFIQEFGDSKLLTQTRYLDLRLDGQIILKKRV